MDTAPGIAKRLDTASRPILRRTFRNWEEVEAVFAEAFDVPPTPKDRNVAGGEMRTTLPADRGDV